MISRGTLPLHLTAATLLRVSAEGMATALVLTVEARTGRAADAGFLQTAATLPYVLSGPLIGHALDRARRPRPLIMMLAAGYAVAAASLLLMAGRSPLVLALLVAAVIGVTEPVVVALTSLLPRYVPAERLPRAYGLEASSYNVAAIAGPGLAAGLASATTGTYAGFAVAASAIVALLVLPLLPIPGPAAPIPRDEQTAAEADPSSGSSGAGEAALSAPGREMSRGTDADGGAPQPAGPAGSGEAATQAPRQQTGGSTDADGRAAADAGGGRGGARVLVDAVAGGLWVLVGNRVLRALTAATSLAWLGWGGIAIAAVLLAERLDAEPSAGGQLMVAVAVGSLAGSLASARWLRPRHAERVMVVGLVAFGGALAALAWVPSLPWALLCFLAAGLCEGPVFAATLMLRQRESPPERLGQVNTTGGSLKIGTFAVGAALTGMLADHLGPDGLVLAIAACQFAGAAVGLLLLGITGRADRAARSRA
ncbi:MFS transporter [Actinomadura keratinilytica]|uniref:MFS transporter n=1 Tax=Actinomadura keratinilytica TaxID=547461 RepID=UPI0031ED1FF2